MNRTKFSGFILSLLIFSMLISGCEGNSMHPEKEADDFLDLIEQKEFEDLSLIIYYMSPFISTRAPLSIDGLINSSHMSKTAIDGNSLKEHNELLSLMSDAELIPVEYASHINARVYYVFEVENGDKVFEVAMWGSNNSIFINGIEIEENDVFYDVILPFLPEDAASELGSYIGARTIGDST